MQKKDKLVTVGKLGATYGYKGWIRINSYTEEVTNIFSYPSLFVNLQGTLTPIKIEDWKVHAGHLVCKIDFLNTMEEAKALNNLYVYVKDSDIQPQEGEYYWKDLIGCTVYNTEGYELGTVKQIIETGANDVLELKAPLADKYRKKDRLVPFTDDFLVSVEVNDKRIVMNWDPDF